MSTTMIARLVGGAPAVWRGQLSGGVAAMIGAGAHLSLLGLFAAHGIWSMALFNVMSVALFAICAWMFAVGRLRLAVALISLEVLVHQIAAVLLCGWDAGFQYYLGTLPLAWMVPTRPLVGWAVTAVVLVVFVALAIVAPAAPPWPFPPAIERALGIANPVAAFAVLWTFMVLYRRRADDIDAALAAALERSDALLRAILPASLVERLREQPTRVAESYPEVSILFADIVGFTPLAERIAPEALVALLDELFAGFDALVEARGLEKIKTIGDAYMVAAGAPERRADHASAIADLALAIREHAAAFAARRGEPISLRIGVHSGAVVAGVIGRSKLAFDLWGDAVNTAARMESHGEAGKIHVSGATAALLGPAFVVEARGVVDIKGKGPMATAWLLGRANASDG